MKADHRGPSIDKQSVMEIEIVARDEKQNSYLPLFQLAFIFFKNFQALKMYFMHKVLVRLQFLLYGGCYRDIVLHRL